MERSSCELPDAVVASTEDNTKRHEVHKEDTRVQLEDLSTTRFDKRGPLHGDDVAVVSEEETSDHQEDELFDFVDDELPQSQQLSIWDDDDDLDKAASPNSVTQTPTQQHDTQSWPLLTDYRGVEDWLDAIEEGAAKEQIQPSDQSIRHTLSGGNTESEVTLVKKSSTMGKAKLVSPLHPRTVPYDLKVRLDRSGESAMENGIHRDVKSIQLGQLGSGEGIDSGSQGNTTKEKKANEADAFIGFMEQFESLGLEDEDECHDEGSSHNSNAADLNITASEVQERQWEELLSDLHSHSAIVEYVSTLHVGKDSPTSAFIQNFQKLMAPVLEGEKPSILHTFQIRHAAERAEISSQLVDKLLKHSNEPTPDVSRVSTSNLDSDISRYDESADDCYEDDVLSEFLTRFDTFKAGDDDEVPKEDIFEDEDENIEVDATYGSVSKEIEQKDDKQNSTEEIRQQSDVHGKNKRVEESWSESDRTQEGTTFSSSSYSSQGDFSYENEGQTSRGARHSRPPKRRYESKKPGVSFGYNNRVDKEIWNEKNDMANYGVASWLTVSAPETLNAVYATECLSMYTCGKRLLPGPKPWRLSYKERTKNHSGFRNVDMYSLFEASALNPASDDEQDLTAWEHRDVQQRFLYEQSLSFSRNWFGRLPRARGNKKNRAPVCRPQSMEMTMGSIPDPSEWTAEWYTIWKSPTEKYRVFNRSKSSTVGSRGDSEVNPKDDGSCYSAASKTSHRSLDSRASSCSRSDGYSDDGSWEEAPECGEIVNVKQKIGERVTLVHPNHISSLRRSRWRKHFFPRGSFPYK